MSFNSLISVIIPCYNHGGYLGKAIDSVLGQSYPNIEVIVVDDGSSDDTREVAAAYGEKVRYIYKENGGLSAARNTGLEHAKGAYIVFLDADDWLYPKALQTNLHYLNLHPTAAFVSGSHIRVYFDSNTKTEVVKSIYNDHYSYLLSKGNYIGVPGSVLYHRWVFDEFLFDETLRACEDYDLYLKVARRYPVFHHTEKIAAYNIHSNNMSANSMMMLNAAINVLGRQYNTLKTKKEIKAYKSGIKYWKAFYYNELFKKISHKKESLSIDSFTQLLINKPQYLLRFILKM